MIPPTLAGGRPRAGVTLVVTSACNLRCAYCYQDRHPGRRMSWSTAEQALDVTFDAEADEYWVGFYGGEPLLAWDLVERAVAGAEHRCPPDRRLRLQLTTNGLLLDRAKAAFLAEHEIETRVSFDGSRGAQDLRGRGSHDLVSRRLHELKRAHPDFHARKMSVALTVPPQAVPTLAHSIDALVESGVGTLEITPAGVGTTEWTNGQERELEWQMSRLYRGALQLYRRTRRVPVALFRRGPGHVRARGDGPMCGLADTDTLTVDVDGAVYGCTALAHSYQRFEGPGAKWLASWSAGPVGAPELAARIRRFRSDVRSSPLFGEREGKGSSRGRCRSCRFLPECVVCPAAIARNGPDPHRIPDYLCAFNRVSLGYRERFPAQLRRSPALSAPPPSAS